eukprot:6174371-Pleurochrysis_carterae.AAC.3
MTRPRRGSCIMRQVVVALEGVDVPVAARRPWQQHQQQVCRVAMGAERQQGTQAVPCGKRGVCDSVR